MSGTGVEGKGICITPAPWKDRPSNVAVWVESRSDRIFLVVILDFVDPHIAHNILWVTSPS